MGPYVRGYDGALRDKDPRWFYIKNGAYWGRKTCPCSSEYDELCTEQHEQLKTMYACGEPDDRLFKTKGWQRWIQIHEKELEEYQQKYMAENGPSTKGGSV
ncbi:hypothetical protein CPC16_003076 [Podila verticillata]|nr:hypothetical protein BGZ59_002589 [Podila verticillata]KAF9371418.1 hypothetical protein CPC16_003076 [Podila verticillata]